MSPERWRGRAFSHCFSKCFFCPRHTCTVFGSVLAAMSAAKTPDRRSECCRLLGVAFSYWCFSFFFLFSGFTFRLHTGKSYWLIFFSRMVEVRSVVCIASSVQQVDLRHCGHRENLHHHNHRHHHHHQLQLQKQSSLTFLSGSVMVDDLTLDSNYVWVSYWCQNVLRVFRNSTFFRDDPYVVSKGLWKHLYAAAGEKLWYRTKIELNGEHVIKPKPWVKCR